MGRHCPCSALNTRLRRLRFFNKYDASNSANDHSLESMIINDNFAAIEVETAIDKLKNNKSPGIVHIPAEIIKQCKHLWTYDIAMVLIYIIQFRNFPQTWTEGLRSAVFKAVTRTNTNNYRGVTLLPVIENIFEIIVYRRMSFANEVYHKIDIYNGGFLADSRTSDNMFILQGMIQRQFCIGNSLITCFIDFSKAFVLINRHILFYKIMKSGWQGRVVDTLRNPYSKTCYRVKRNGRISDRIFDKLCVNQGGVASGFLFRKYMADLGTYLKTNNGICLGEHVICHLLWADDLIFILKFIPWYAKTTRLFKNFLSLKSHDSEWSKNKIHGFWPRKYRQFVFQWQTYRGSVDIQKPWQCDI